MRAKLSAEQKKARERMRLVEPENAYKVLGHPRYWMKEFLRLYLDRCDALALDEPDRACAMAEHAPILAQRIRVGDGFAEFRSDAERRSHQVLALAVRGTCCRAAERLSDAEACFATCAPFLTQGVSLEAAAELKRRQAGLLAMQGRDLSFEIVEQSLALFERSPQLEGRAEGLLLRGALHYLFGRGSGLEDGCLALDLARPDTERGRRTIEASLHFLVRAMLEGRPTLAEQQQSYRMLQRVKKGLANRPKSLRKMKVFWLEGLLLANLGITRHAVRRLQKAREGILALGHGFELAIVSLDLACAHLGNDEPRLAEELAETTLEELRRLDVSQSVREALAAWPRASLAGAKMVQLKRALVTPRTGQLIC